MSIHLKQPYKITLHKLKRYAAHYNIPAENCVIVPMASFGHDHSCEVRWENSNGELHMKDGLFFSEENIEPLNALKDPGLHEIWLHYYSN